MEFKFYYKLYLKGNIYRYYKTIRASNLEEGKKKFLNYVNKYEKSSKIEVMMIQKVVGNNIFDLKES